MALGADATFVARTHDMDRKHMQEVFKRAHAHQGAAFVEVLQNCNVFNNHAYDQITARANREDMIIPLRQGEPIRFGPDGEQGRRARSEAGRGGRRRRRRGRGRAAGPQRDP